MRKNEQTYTRTDIPDHADVLSVVFYQRVRGAGEQGFALRGESWADAAPENYCIADRDCEACRFQLTAGMVWNAFYTPMRLKTRVC